MIRVLLWLSLATLTLAQLPRNRQELPLGFIVDRASTSVTSEKITVQLPATFTRVHLKAAKIYCSTACVITQERNGTAATATSLTVNKVNPEADETLRVVAFRSSNVGTAALTYTTDALAAGETLPLDLSDVYLIGSTGAVNYSIGVTLSTGNVTIAITGEQY